MNQYITIYKTELLENVVPFWMKHSKDSADGGFFTCLDREGKIYDTDKFVWLQARQVWLFSLLYDKVRKDPAWLDMARHGADFLLQHGRDGAGDWFFSLDKQGRPLTQPYNIFADCFASMGLGKLYAVLPHDEYAEVARKTFERILARLQNPKGRYSKHYPGTRDLKGFSLPMILSNLALEVEHILDKGMVDSLLQEIVHEVMEVFYHEDEGLILENVNPDGSFNDSFEGRLLNPGHSIEAMWFIMDVAIRLNDRKLAEKAVDIALRTLEYGWDKEFGGIFYFMDIKGYPMEKLEWDQKLWWVHMEALICMAKGWALTGNEQCKVWFERLHQYTFARFPDSVHGEWYGYLNRRGEVLLPLKGGKWKGCFHVPRGLYQVYSTLEKENVQIATNKNVNNSIEI